MGTSFATLLAVAAVAGPSVTGSSGNELPKKGRVGYWRFENTPRTGKSGVEDASAAANHAAAKGGARSSEGGKVGRCALLADQGSYVECPAAANLNPEHVTVMAWFRAAKGSLRTQKPLVLKSFTAHRRPYYQYGLCLMDNGPHPRCVTFYACVDGKLATCGERNAVTDMYDAWHHAAGVFDGQSMKLYVDGQLVQEIPKHGTLSRFNTPLLIGAYANLPKTDVYTFKGHIDEVAVYRRALGGEEIRQYYRSCDMEMLLRFPGVGKPFGPVSGDHFAAESFVAPGPCLVDGAVWLSEPNDDELLVRIVQEAPNGKVVGAASLSAGKAGERRFVFRPSVVLRQGGTYFLKVMAGAPGTTRGAVQCQTPNPQTKGHSEHGESTDDMAYELFFQRRVTSWSHAVSVRPATPEDIAYEERLNDALRAKRDVLGEALIARPGGPTYEGIAPLVRPLMLVGANITTSGVYYLVFGEPDGVTGGGDCALHVADGSEIISRHHKHGRRTQFYVGAGGDELFGASRTGLRQEPRLDGGYYPILVTECRDARGVRYRHESLATRIGETSSLVSFIKITVERAESRAKTTFFRIKVGKRGLHVEGHRLVEDGKTVLAFSPGGRYEEPFLTYRPDLAAVTPGAIYLARLNHPAPCADFAPDERRFVIAKRYVREQADKELAHGAAFEVPEPRVMNAMRNLLLQNLFMTWRYSIGNAYESWYPKESGDVLKTLGEYGFLTHYRDNLDVLIPRVFRGEDERMMEWGHKFAYAAHYTLLTRDFSLVKKHDERFRQWRDRMIAVMEADPKGLLGKSRAGDIHTHEYYSNHQAAEWRGLRDMGLVYGMLEQEDGSRGFTKAASRLKSAFFKAFDAAKVEMSDGALFFPKVLGENTAKPYDPITATRLGSYWNLSIGTALRSGILDPQGDAMRKSLAYVLYHGGRFLGLTRFNYYPVPVGECREDGLPGYKTTGADNVYGLGVIDALAEQDEADQIVLTLYGKLAHGMTRNTFIAGEGDTIGVVPGEFYRSFYLPPNSTNNALFLKTLRDMLIFERVDAAGRPSALLITHFTPRSWLADGKEIRVVSAPTMFGMVSFDIRSRLKRHAIDAVVDLPKRNPPRVLTLRLRTPGKRRMEQVLLDGHPFERFDPGCEQIDLSGVTGRLRVEVRYFK